MPGVVKCFCQLETSLNATSFHPVTKIRKQTLLQCSQILFSCQQYCYLYIDLITDIGGLTKGLISLDSSTINIIV